MKFRDLTASEIDVRVAKITDKGCSLLLYKDARVDMDILDETVGPMNWQRSHSRENANCIISIWDSEKKQWISKEDTGTESNTEKEKGLASDSFKRSGFNWGIGRELYTAPFIWVDSSNFKIEESNGRRTTQDRFAVKNITISNKKIVGLEIINIKTKKVVFKMGQDSKQEEPTKAEQEEIDKIKVQKINSIKINAIKKEIERTGVTEKSICATYGINYLEDMTEEMFSDAVIKFQKYEDKKEK